jgi:hypothetical protein
MTVPSREVESRREHALPIPSEEEADIFRFRLTSSQPPTRSTRPTIPRPYTFQQETQPSEKVSLPELWTRHTNLINGWGTSGRYVMTVTPTVLFPELYVIPTREDFLTALRTKDLDLLLSHSHYRMWADRHGEVPVEYSEFDKLFNC